MSRPRSTEPNKIIGPKDDSVTVTVQESPVADGRKDEEDPNVPEISPQTAAELALGRASHLKDNPEKPEDPAPEVDPETE